MLSPLILVSFAASWLYLPTNMPKLNLRQTLAKVDLLGVITGTAAIILLLIPISDGGHKDMPWSSPSIIAMLTTGSVCLVAFILIEWKWATLPMMPLGMFRKPSVAAMLAQSFLLGNAYYSLIYFLPLYFQNVRGKSPLISAVHVLPLVVVQSCFSTSAGLYMTYMNRYAETIWFGFATWTIGGGLLTLTDETTSFGMTSLFLVSSAWIWLHFPTNARRSTGPLSQGAARGRRLEPQFPTHGWRCSRTSNVLGYIVCNPPIFSPS